MTDAHKRPVLGVGGVVIREGRVLLARRGKAPMQGQWSIPGGHLEWGETAEQAVVRELREETGLEVRVIELLEVVERVFDERTAPSANQERERAAASGCSLPPQFHYVILDYYCEAAAGTPQAGADAAELAWATENELTNYNLTEAATRVIHRAFALAHARM